MWFYPQKMTISMTLCAFHPTENDTKSTVNKRGSAKANQRTSPQHQSIYVAIELFVFICQSILCFITSLHVHVLLRWTKILQRHEHEPAPKASGVSMDTLCRTHTHTHTRTRTLKVSQMQNFILHFNVNHGLDTLEAVGQQRNVAPLT